MLRDKFGREIRDLRISVTDRCNLACVYCKSVDSRDYFPHGDLLTWDEFLRVARVLAGLGIRKVRVTGGEPLLRPGIIDFVARLGRSRASTMSRSPPTAICCRRWRSHWLRRVRRESR